MKKHITLYYNRKPSDLPKELVEFENYLKNLAKSNGDIKNSIKSVVIEFTFKNKSYLQMFPIIDEPFYALKSCFAEVLSMLNKMGATKVCYPYALTH